MNIDLILSHYFKDISKLNTTVFAGGHINSTYKVSRNAEEYILQKINEKVFTEPEKVMDNLVIISDTLNQIDYPLTNLSPVKTLGNKNFVQENGTYWRMFPFYNNAYTPLEVTSKEIAFEAARGYGLFERYLKNVNTDKLFITIPDFFNFSKRFENFKKAVNEGQDDRVKNCKKEIEILLADEWIISEATAFQTKIPLRPIHGDAKSSNVMLSKETNQAVIVSDLDTLMPGHILYDFGDMVRSFTCSTPEDSDNYAGTFKRWDYMEALCKGFLGEISPSLSNDELVSLISGSAVVTFVQAIRFLADYIQGDIYYQTKYSEHNLVRAKNQISMYKSIVSKKGEIEELVMGFG